MIFKPAIWRPVAFGLSALNLVALGFAIRPDQSWEHGAIHAALALAFGVWALRLGRTSGRSELERGDALDAFEAELGKLRREMSETQERLDFAERLLAQRPEARRVGPQP